MPGTVLDAGIMAMHKTDPADLAHLLSLKNIYIFIKI